MKLLLLIALTIALTRAQTRCPSVACSFTLAEDICFEYTGTNGNTATMNFKACEDGQICDFARVNTQSYFQAYGSATALTVTERKTAYCIPRDGLRNNLLPGAKCQDNGDCLSNRCFHTSYGSGYKCVGVDDHETCTSHDECEWGYFCDTVSNECQKQIGRDEICTLGSDVCENGYYCAQLGTGTHHCYAIFSQPDGTDVSHWAICESGFRDAATRICYNPSKLWNQALTAELTTSPYACDLNTGNRCGSSDENGNNRRLGVACLCEWGTNTQSGFCAWRGDNTYKETNYFTTLKRAVEGSFDCHF